MSHPFKFTAPTDKMPGRRHGAYLSVYARLLAPLRDTEDSVAELGVDGAGSLLMYADYFYRSKPLGMDIRPEPRAIRAHPRIRFHQGDAYSPEGFETIREHAPFALIVDDGPHTIDSQKIFCARYPSLLSPQGLCIVEDIQKPAHFAELPKAVSDEFFSFGIDLRWHDDRCDNLLFVIQRR
jgi:cephalosporin hydroxylase